MLLCIPQDTNTVKLAHSEGRKGQIPGVSGDVLVMVESFMPLLAQCRDVPSTEEAALGAWQFSELMRMGMAVNSYLDKTRLTHSYLMAFSCSRQ